MSQFKGTNDTNDRSCDDVPTRIWERSSLGTHEIKQRGKKSERNKIANYGIWIKSVSFVLSTRVTEIRYLLEFETPDGTHHQAVRHEHLADEQSFMKVVLPGFAITSQHKAFSLLRECLMEDLPTASREAVLQCFGWYTWQGKPIFAHAGGILSADSDCFRSDSAESNGTSQLHDVVDVDKACSDVPILAGPSKPVSVVRVEAKQHFSKYQLTPPDTKKDVHAAVAAVLELLKVGDPKVTYIAIPALFATAIQNPRFALFLYGESGSLKTAFALLLLSFFCPDAQESDCASFKSTDNSLRARFAPTGNVAVVVDDYVQFVGSRNGGDEAKKAENLIRSVVNGAGKDRCFGDGSLRPVDRPRGLPIITGEVLPDGLESLRRRTVTLPVDKPTFGQAIRGSRPNQFDSFQSLAANGTFTRAMAAFIAWAAGRLEDLREFLDNPSHDIPDEHSVHPRVFDATKYILSGAAMLLSFARHIGVCSDDEYENHETLVVEAAIALLDRTHLESLEDSPTEAFGQLLQAALSSLRCHIEVRNIDDYKDSEHAVPLELLGYTKHEIRVTNPSSKSDTSDSEEVDGDGDEAVEYKPIYKSHGKRIGWLDFDRIDLIPEAALVEANNMAGKAGISELPPKKSFGKMLKSKNWIADQNGDRNTLKVRRDKILHEVWRIHPLRLFEYALSWGTFDVESYRQMSNAERQTLCVSHREKMLSELRERLSSFQVESLLNPVLTESDRSDLLIPDPPEVEGRADATGENGKRYKPAPPRPQALPSYGNPDDDEDGLDS